jgi:hypothetical protein
VNHRLKALLLTSWPVIDTMYDDKWLTETSGGVAWKEIEDESIRWDVSEFNNVAPYGKKWPNPNEKCLDGTACVFCQNSFGPKGYYWLGTCACLYHPQCLIRGMVTIRRCQVCHATFHPRLYQMFGMQDFMPTYVYYSIYDFPNVALEKVVYSVFGIHPIPFLLPIARLSVQELLVLPALPLLLAAGPLRMESAPYWLRLDCFGSCPSDGECSLSASPLLALEAALQTGSAPYRLCMYKPWKLLFKWGALPISSTHSIQTTCSLDGERSLSKPSCHWVSPPLNFHSLSASPWFGTK